MEDSSPTGSVRKIAMLGNHAPRQCGIATFTTHLCDAVSQTFPQIECFVLAMNDPGRNHAYPVRVRFAIDEGDSTSYLRAADYLNVNAVDVVSVQHEYGIFGGKAGSLLLLMLRELRMPIVTTMHTILAEPNGAQRTVMNELTRLSERIVVMSARGADLLQSVHGVSASKIDLIPHGIPVVPPQGRSKDRLGVEGKLMILTFGLLSPDKGIEYVIDALPAIVARHPNTLYVVLGATHPHVRERAGEAYRISLEARAKRLGVAANIIFHDRFVTESELAEFLAAADIYATPYLNPEQITSGTLAYAVGAGKAVISTPYTYARELLADERGILVPCRDSNAIATAAIGLLDDPAVRAGYASRAIEHGRGMVWPAVAGRYVTSFDRARGDDAERRRSLFQARTLAARPAVLPATDLHHLRVLTDDTGILQHASFNVPRYEDGYCVDDNARALLLTALLEDAGTEDRAVLHALSTRYLAFVRHAFNLELGRFRNFMSYTRRWNEACGSEDAHGRSLWALGTVVGRSNNPGRRSLARQLFHAALPATSTFKSPRAWAFGLLGIDEYLRAFQGDRDVEALRASLARLLFELHQRTSSADWPWFEPYVTYENPRMSQAMLVSGVRMNNEAMVAVGVRSLHWLASIQQSAEGYFSPVGSDGFYPRGGRMAAFDQQPVEAAAMVSACLEARRITNDARWTRHAQRAFGWFLGQNQIQQRLYDPATGSCCDGLHPDRINENQGAESTLSFLMALVEIREAERLESQIHRAVEVAS